MFSDEPGDYILSSLSDMFEESEEYFLTDKELKDWLDELFEPEDYFNKGMFEEPGDYINSCERCIVFTYKGRKERIEKKLINDLPFNLDKSPCLFKIKTIEGIRGYINKNEDWVESDVVHKEDDILYVSGYKDEPIIITDKSDNILFMINDNNKNIKLDNIEKININIDLYYSKIVYIDTITVKQKVALMLSLMNYEGLPYEVDLFKKICNYIT